MGSTLRAAGRVAAMPLRDIVDALDRTAASGPRPWFGMSLFVMAAAAGWFVYVPVHELLHVAGCEATGGDVHRMTLDPIYGGRLLASWFPIVEPGGEHAGRLTSFETHGSDLCYLATDAAPFLMTLAGVPLLRIAVRRGSPAFAGAATVLALSPFLSLTGDYFEMASVIVTRATAPFEIPPEPYSGATGLMALRSDDLPALLREVASDPQAFAEGVAGGLPAVAAVIALSAAAAVVLAFATYSAGDLIARRWAAAGITPGEARRG